MRNSTINNSIIDGIFTLFSENIQLSHPNNKQKKVPIRYYTFMKKVNLVIDELIKRPYSTAFYISKKFSLSFLEVAAIYKIIQISDPIQQEFMHSYNKDYINIVKSHFEKKAFEVVFFVGLSCPLRCIFCPSVIINDANERELRQYYRDSKTTITKDEVERVFSDINQMKISGINVLVKISGGLEPFTSLKHLEWVLEQSSRYEIPSQIFTNGVLLNSPPKRSLALKATGVRVSISAPNQEMFRKLCLAGVESSRFSLDLLVQNLKNLIAERNNSDSSTIIGINSVIGDFNWSMVGEFIDLAVNIGVDYIDIKPDYFSEDKGWMDNANKTISEIKSSLANDKRQKTKIVFAASLNKNNMFNAKMEGKTSLDTQIHHKLFITPYGECSPVHHGAFPDKIPDGKETENLYRLGKVTKTKGIIELISNAHNLPEISFDLLNPYERILALESKRRKEDEVFGITQELSPYDNGNKIKRFPLPLPDSLIELENITGEFHDLRA